MSLQDEIQQNKPFKSPQEEVLLSILRTAELVSYATAEALKPYGVTMTQYNVLRILRGAGKAGLPCGAIAERMITRDSDITRLLDRMAAMNLVTRGRGEEDRRVVTVTLTDDGRALLTRMDPVMTQTPKDLLDGVDRKVMDNLIRGLEQVREGLLATTR